MPNLKDFISVTAKILPSMRKDRMYTVKIVICESTNSVATAYYTYIAGRCNHVTGTLYCLEDYMHQGLQGKERKGCTERLQNWNPPKRTNEGGMP